MGGPDRERTVDDEEELVFYLCFSGTGLKTSLGIRDTDLSVPGL